MNRRGFIGRGLSLGAAAAVAGAVPARASASGSRPSLSSSGRATTPMMITSHTNDTGRRAAAASWQILSGGGTAMDAVERGANIIELDPDETSVGWGGLPNAEGVVQLDASVMDGATYNAGSVAGIEGIRTPASVARLVMERTDHVMLIGDYAQRFAVGFGFEVQELMTPKSREIWLRWRERLSDTDDWGPPDHLRRPRDGSDGGGLDEAEQWAELLDLPGRDGPDRDYVLAEALLHRYGTTNVLAVDAQGNVSGITTTSGLAWKVPGRVGDSPIIGAGLYVDNDIGAAAVTGRGEDVIKSCAGYYVVSRMGAGRTPQQACEDAVAMIRHKYRSVNPDFIPSEKFVAINKDGDYGCAWMPFRDTPPRMTVANADGVQTYEGVSVAD
ncbi:MAG: N(4)-(beta-N-acetylglucosaminyl)-L-asparaginase [Gemmatimonadota bacterium]|uniref:N(4)-(beta-N-acetylglucosaminyl)-L-asparaginase n=1 Tax=Candidatus Palauibacter scopulicola TaxID=3056741 RepID=UPI00238EFB16|nr:N(4)-(beta-N-acetylglucosaminyl)-L-asparaginase [Candidatus Palauibacter scopulicola]MDE2661751.1 N(4)-(beta-N-acetylglucosaminyl)-L-asparaginase [Candidatus Palauibacter scopulicola]